MKTRSYPIKTSQRTGTLTVTEHPDRIVIVLQLDRYGEVGDEAELIRQMAPVLMPLNTDPRPFVFDVPDLGSKAVIDLTSDGRPFAIVADEVRH
jgi:hypothetical protein